MLKKFAFLTIILLQVVSTQAQEFKFGVHVDPFLSFLDTDFKHVVGDAVNGGVALGVEAEYRFSENVAFTFGIDFSINNGGSLLYRYGGVLFKNTELDRNAFQDLGGTTPSSGTELNIAAFTKVNYGINYIQVPVGLKLRTNELGGSYIRAFFHIPLIKIMVPVSASARIFSPKASATDYKDDLTGYKIPNSNEGFSEEKNVWKDITPLQIGIGAGAGVEFAPNSDGGLRLYAGIYYDAGILDVTGGFAGTTNFKEATVEKTPAPNRTTNEGQEDSRDINPRNALNTISLRIGIIF